MTSKITTSKITEIRVYWDNQDRDNEGWAVRWFSSDREMGSDGIGIDSKARLDDAIDQACYELGVDLTHDDFACSPDVDGGHASWAAE